MIAELHVLTGDRAGVVIPLADTECTVGRSAACTLRFAANAERGVSARHARFVRDVAGWVLHDLGSTNHTWLNGCRVHRPVRLRDGDRIALGRRGPVLEIRIGGAPRRTIADADGRRSVAPLALATAVCIAGILAAMRIDRAAPPAPEPIVRAAPRILRSPSPPPRAPVAARPRSRPDRVPEPSRPVAASGARPSAHLPRDGATGDPNRRAVARIWVEGSGGEVWTGTAFAVSADGILVTSRHVVDGGGRIAVQFSGSAQVWRARVTRVSRAWDLALVQVEGIVGGVPTVRGLNLRADTLPPDAPVVLLGFPGTDAARKGIPARPVRSTAAFGGVRGGRVEVHARSAAGASGSPLFDAEGRALGVLFGGDPRAPRPVLYAVPATEVARLLDGG